MEQPGDKQNNHTMEVSFMSLSILTNISAMNTQQNLLASSNAVATSMQRLSSGLQINSAADDAAGYAISEGLTSQVNGLNQASSNTNDAISMVQTASSSLSNVQDMLQRVYELGVQMARGSRGDLYRRNALGANACRIVVGLQIAFDDRDSVAVAKRRNGRFQQRGLAGAR